MAEAPEAANPGEFTTLRATRKCRRLAEVIGGLRGQTIYFVLEDAVERLAESIAAGDDATALALRALLKAGGPVDPPTAAPGTLGQVAGGVRKALRGVERERRKPK